MFVNRKPNNPVQTLTSDCPGVRGGNDLLAYWRLDSKYLPLKDHVQTSNFSGYYQQYVERPFPSTQLKNEKRSFVEVNDTCFTLHDLLDTY